MVPEKPNGSGIEEQITADACILKWRLPSSGLGEIRGILGTIVLAILFFGSLAWVWTGNPWSMMTGSGVLLSLGLLLGLGSFRRGRPEVLTLGVAYFRHELGRPGGWLSTMDRYFIGGPADLRPMWRRLLSGPPLIVELPKEELGQIVAERGGVGQLRLRYDVGADRIEIGRYLSEPEKEWLAEVLGDWQG
jgi:hypothetical protein